ncbi:hypothetical protein CCP3SC1_1700002 [Gammaproteobacteria bacterium]
MPSFAALLRQQKDTHFVLANKVDVLLFTKKAFDRTHN